MALALITAQTTTSGKKKAPKKGAKKKSTKKGASKRSYGKGKK